MRRLLTAALTLTLLAASSVYAADETGSVTLRVPATVLAAASLADAEQSAIVFNNALKTAPAPSTKRPFALPALYIASAGLQAFDAYSTLSALKLGGVEQNPLMRTVVKNPAALVAVKAGVTVASITAAEQLWRSHHRVGAIGLMVASNAMMAVVAAHNASVLSSMR
jgi:hypothetical protein